MIRRVIGFGVLYQCIFIGRMDKELALEAVKQEKHALMNAPEEPKADKEVVPEAVKKDRGTFDGASKGSSRRTRRWPSRRQSRA